MRKTGTIRPRVLDEVIAGIRVRANEGGHHRRTTRTPTISHRRGPPLEAGQVGTRSEAGRPYLQQFHSYTQAKRHFQRETTHPKVRAHTPMSGSERLLAACPPKPIPPAAGRFDRLPVALRPLGHRSQRPVELAAKVSELIQRGRLDPPTVEMPGNEPVAFRSAKRLGQHLVRDAIQGIVEVLVTAASLK